MFGLHRILTVNVFTRCPLKSQSLFSFFPPINPVPDLQLFAALSSHRLVRTLFLLYRCRSRPFVSPWRWAWGFSLNRGLLLIFHPSPFFNRVESIPSMLETFFIPPLSRRRAPFQ